MCGSVQYRLAGGQVQGDPEGSVHIVERKHLAAGAVEVEAADFVGLGFRCVHVGGVDLATTRIQGNVTRIGDPHAHQGLHLGTVQVGALDTLAYIGPVELAASGIQGDLVGSSRPVGDVLGLGAIEIGALDSAEYALGPVHLAGGDIQRQAVAPGLLQPRGLGRHQVLDPAAIQVGTLNLVRDAVGPVHLAGGDVERQATRALQTRDHQVFDLRAIEIGALNLLGAGVGPVDLAGGDIERDSIGIVQGGDNQVFDLGTVDVGAPDLVRAVVGPVQLAADGIHCKAVRAGGTYEGLDSAPVEVGTLNSHVPVGPVDLVVGDRQCDAVRFDQPVRKQILDLRAVQPRALDGVAPGVSPIDMSRSRSRVWRRGHRGHVAAACGQQFPTRGEWPSADP